MFNYILVGLGILLGSNLIVWNIITSSRAYIFTIPVNAAVIIFVSLIIWLGIWFWLKWIFSKKDNNDQDDDYNF